MRNFAAASDRSPLVIARLLSLAALATTAAWAGCGKQAPCKPGTLFVTVEFAGPALDVTSVAASVISGGAQLAGPSGTFSHDPGQKVSTLEVDFRAGSYPAGQPLDLTLTALGSDGAALATKTQHVDQLAAGCAALTVSLGAGGTGAGGNGGAAGGAGATAPTGAGGGAGGYGGGTTGLGGAAGAAGGNHGTAGGGNGGTTSGTGGVAGAAGGSHGTGGVGSGGITAAGGTMGSTGGMTGTGGLTPGSGGAAQGSGGVVGTGGMQPGTGGMAPGTGGQPAGGAPGTAGAGGSPSLMPVAAAWDGQLVTYPCGTSGSGYDCANIGCAGGMVTLTTSWTMAGAASNVYSVTFNVRGIVEAYAYSGGTRDGGSIHDSLDLFQSGGTPLSSGQPGYDYNTYELDVSPGVAGETNVYFLNSVTAAEGPHAANSPTQHLTFPIDYIKTIKVMGDSTVTLKTFDSNCALTQNCGPTASTICTAPRTVNLSGVMPPAPASFLQPFQMPAGRYGQWLYFDVTSVTAN